MFKSREMLRTFDIRSFLVLLIGLLICACAGEPIVETQMPPAIQSSEAAESANPAAEPTRDEETKYPGVTIDEQFPVAFHGSRIDDNRFAGETVVAIGDFQVRIAKYEPATISKDPKKLFSFKARSPGEYWANVVGSSKLLGPDSTQIYVEATGPGGVCCTNYWITDVSSGTPRSIFRSEDFGHFRNQMEVFDAEGDGVYELVQFDSCFRYFMDDCGSCSPEPRAVFKYDRAAGQYRPEPNLQQNFAHSSMVDQENSIRERFEANQLQPPPNTDIDLNRSVLAHVVELFHIGQGKNAWAFFDRYYDDPNGEARKEIKHRLAGCKFYQGLRSRS